MKKRKAVLFVILVFIVVSVSFFVSATNYYVNATTGSDSNAGTSPATAWKTIAHVNSQTFNPGDNIYFERGDTWREKLRIPSSGNITDPITFGAYGNASKGKPIISGADVVNNWTLAVTPTQDHGGMFSSGFENTSLSEWTSISNSGASVTADASAKLHGSYGLLYNVTNPNDSRGYLTESFSNITSGSVYVRFYFYIPSGAINPSTTFRPLTLQESGNDRMKAWMDTNASGDIRLNVVLNPYAVIYQGTYGEVTRNAWHSLEIQYKVNSTTGGGEVWLDGVSMGSNFAQNTSSYRPNSILLGQSAYGKISPLDSKLYFDDVKIDTSRVGSFLDIASNVYNTTLTTEPNIVFFNNSRGTNVSSITNVNSSDEWYWKNNTLYAYYPADPNGTGAITASQREGAINTGLNNNTIIKDFKLIGTQIWGGGVVVNGSTNVTITNCNLTNNYYMGVVAKNTHKSITVENSIISYNGFAGTDYWYTSGLGTDLGHNLYYNNTIFDNGWVPYQSSSGIIESSNYTEISHNIIYGNGDTNQNAASFSHNHGIYVGHDTDVGYNIHDNIVYDQRYGSGIKMVGGGSIYRNKVYDNYQSGITVGFSSDSVTDNVFVYSNVLYDNHFGLWEYDNTAGSYNLYLYNNVFENNTDETLDIYSEDISITDALNTFVMKNNILSGYNDYHHEISLVPQTGTVSIDYNLYQYDNNSFWDGSANRNFSYWQNTMGYDTHGVRADPLFADAAGGNFTLKSGSPAINAGTALNSTYELGLAANSTWPNKVYSLNQNKFGSGWEIGAYVYQPVSTSSGGSTGSSVGGGSYPNYVVNQTKIGNGYNINLSSNWKVSFNINNESHSVRLDNVTGNSATITVSSTPQTFSLSEGQVKKIDLNGNGYYDLEVTLNSIANNQADLTIKSINETMVNGTSGNVGTNATSTSSPSTASSSTTTYVIIGIILLTIIIAAIWFFVKRRSEIYRG